MVAAGLTVVEPLAEEEVNVPGVMAIVVAPVVLQFSVVSAPLAILVGLAVKEVTAGREVVVEVFPGVEPQPVKLEKLTAARTKSHTVRHAQWGASAMVTPMKPN